MSPKVENDTQRNKLFHTKCTINKPLFDLIIDSARCENIIDGETLKRLGLIVEKHPNHYTIG